MKTWVFILEVSNKCAFFSVSSYLVSQLSWRKHTVFTASNSKTQNGIANLKCVSMWLTIPYFISHTILSKVLLSYLLFHINPLWIWQHWYNSFNKKKKQLCLLGTNIFRSCIDAITLILLVKHISSSNFLHHSLFLHFSKKMCNIPKFYDGLKFKYKTKIC